MCEVSFAASLPTKTLVMCCIQLGSSSLPLSDTRALGHPRKLNFMLCCGAQSHTSSCTAFLLVIQVIMDNTTAIHYVKIGRSTIISALQRSHLCLGWSICHQIRPSSSGSASSRLAKCSGKLRQHTYTSGL